MIVGLLMWMACSIKQEDPDLLVPPVGYDVNTVTEAGYRLCIESIPKDSEILVSSRHVDGCTSVQGEVFVEVSAPGYISYREPLMVEGDLTHKVMLLPTLTGAENSTYPMPTEKSVPKNFVQPTKVLELCVDVIPSDVYLQINGVKRPVGSCTKVQNAAEVRIEADGYESYKKLWSMPPDAESPKKIQIVLVPTVDSPSH